LIDAICRVVTLDHIRVMQCSKNAIVQRTKILDISARDAQKHREDQ